MGHWWKATQGLICKDVLDPLTAKLNSIRHAFFTPERPPNFCLILRSPITPPPREGELSHGTMWLSDISFLLQIVTFNSTITKALNKMRVRVVLIFICCKYSTPPASVAQVVYCTTNHGLGVSPQGQTWLTFRSDSLESSPKSTWRTLVCLRTVHHGLADSHNMLTTYQRIVEV